MKRHAADTHGRAGRACFQPEAKEDRYSNGSDFNWTHWLLDQSVEGYAADTQGRAGRAYSPAPYAGNQTDSKFGSSWTDWHFEQSQKESFEKKGEAQANNKGGSWMHLGHGRWVRDGGKDDQQEEAADKQQQEDHQEQTDQHQAKQFEDDNWSWEWWPTEGKRKKKKNPKRKRGGTKKHRRLIGPIRNRHDPNVVSFFFGNITFASEKAKRYIIERNDDVILLAEHHKNPAGTIQLANQFSRHNWRVTASPARPTERSAEGNTGGLLVGIKNYLDSRPPAFATDAEGTLTSNAQLTGRMLVLSWLELLGLAGYLQSGLGFTGSN